MMTSEKNFLAFITVERITGESLATALLFWLETHNINVSFCRGQGYDGASNMAVHAYKHGYAKCHQWPSTLIVSFFEHIIDSESPNETKKKDL